MLFGPTEFVLCPFTLIVDTREQAPYAFHDMPVRARDQGKRLVVPTEFGGLKQGDYAVKGLEDCAAVERKSLEDLYSTIGQGRERFEREIARLNELDRAAVVVEATWEAIREPARFRSRWRSQMRPDSVWGQIFAWMADYPGVHWIPAGNRRIAEIATFKILERFWRKRQETQQEATKASDA